MELLCTIRVQKGITGIKNTKNSIYFSPVRDNLTCAYNYSIIVVG